MVNIPKFKVPVYILMSDGTGIYCVIFARQNQRLIEILGEIRAFIPVETNDGVQLINKAHILRVVVLTKEQMNRLRCSLTSTLIIWKIIPGSGTFRCLL